MPEGVTKLIWEAPAPDTEPWLMLERVNSMTMLWVSREGVKVVAFSRMKLSWMLMPSSVMLV